VSPKTSGHPLPRKRLARTIVQITGRPRLSSSCTLRSGDVYGRHAYGAVRVTERGKRTLPRLIILRPNRGKRQFSVGSLKGNVRSAISGLGTSQHNSWKSHVDDFVPHRHTAPNIMLKLKLHSTAELPRCVSAVFTVTPSIMATSLEVLPSPTSCTTSRSRSDNLGGMATAGPTLWRCR
jgi:hypothetical protein